jgi:hypothetical protein
LEWIIREKLKAEFISPIRNLKKYFFLRKTLSHIVIFFRPDLVDWKKVERRQVRERIDMAFHIMEKEYGVTRLLDPEGNDDRPVFKSRPWGRTLAPKGEVGPQGRTFISKR